MRTWRALTPVPWPIGRIVGKPILESLLAFPTGTELQLPPLVTVLNAVWHADFEPFLAVQPWLAHHTF